MDLWALGLILFFVGVVAFYWWLAKPFEAYDKRVEAKQPQSRQDVWLATRDNRGSDQGNGM